MTKVQKVMLTKFPALKKEALIGDAAKLLGNDSYGCIIVVEGKKPIGIVTELDIMKKAVSRGISFKEPVSRIMNSPLTLMTPDMKLDEALKIIDTKKYRKYPVVQNDELVGLVYKNDVINYISDNVRFHRMIQNIVLVLFVLFEFFVFIINEYFHPYLA